MLARMSASTANSTAHDAIAVEASMARLSRSDARANRSSCRRALIGRWLGCVRGASGAEGYPGYLKLAVAHASRSALSTVRAQQSVAATTQQGSMVCTVGSSVMCPLWARPMVECQWFAMHLQSAAARRGMLRTLHTVGRVRVSVLIDSEPRSCSHAVGRLDHLRVR